MNGAAQPPTSGWLPRRFPASIWGKLLFLAALVLLVAIARGPRAYLLTALIWATAGLYRPITLKEILLSRYTWTFVTISLLMVALVLRQTAFLALEMLAKGLALLVGLRMITLSISMQELLAATAPVMQGRFGFILGVAFHSFNALGQIFEMAFITLKVRQGGPTLRPAGLKRLLITLISNGIRHAEDVVLAALSRGYDGRPLHWSRPRPVYADLLYVAIPIGWWILLALLPG